MYVTCHGDMGPGRLARTYASREGDMRLCLQGYRVRKECRTRRDLTMTLCNEIILHEIIEHRILKSRELRVNIPRREGASGRTGEGDLRLCLQGYRVRKECRT